MKFSHALLLASSLAFLACGDDDDSSSNASDKFDCTVSDGVKVVYPTKGETFKIGQKITVIYGSTVDGDGKVVGTASHMNVRRIVITPIQADNNSKKAANLWHSIFYCFNYYSAKIEKKNYFLNKKRVFLSQLGQQDLCQHIKCVL